MGKIMLIVESKTKIKKIEEILGKDYFVMCTFGHILDLEKKTNNLSVDINDNFRPIYKPLEDKKKVITDLKRASKMASDIFIASDYDREGENIAWCIAYVLGIKDVKRITFISITKSELLHAIKNSRQIDYNLVDSQKCRRILDRIVGYEITPLLNIIGQGNLSAGRVQSVLVRIIIDKENEVNNFMLKDLPSFFKFRASFSDFLPNSKPFVSTMHDIENVNKEGIYKGNVSKVSPENKCRDLFKIFTGSSFWLSAIFDKISVRNPSPPFTTSTMQQDSSRKLGLTGKRTMQAAQNLYEAGYITYMRTDSVNLSDEAIINIKEFILKNYGNKYYRKMLYKSKKKNTQEAHEAIRPCDVFVTELENQQKIGNDEIRLYSLIWKKAVASQMEPARFDIKTIQITIDNGSFIDYFFSTTIENLEFDGFLKIYNLKDIDDDGDKNCNCNCENSNIVIPKLGSNLKVRLIEAIEDYTRPPPRYDEASFTDMLDPKKLNITRPATLSPMINKILDRKYIEIKNIDGFNKNSLSITWDGDPSSPFVEKTKEILVGKEKKRFVPTEVGIKINNYLLKNFPKIIDVHFTESIEVFLEKIAQGKLKYYDFLREFYDEFHPIVLKNKHVNLLEDEKTKNLGKDPTTGYDIVATNAKYGPAVKIRISETQFKWAPIREPLTLDNITLDDALEMFKFPKLLGVYEKNNVILNKGKFGMYVNVGEKKYSVESDKVTLEEVVDVIENKKSLFELKTKTKLFEIYQGPHGKYLKCSEIKKNGKKYTVSFPENTDINSLDEQKIQQIIKNHFDTQKPKNNEELDMNKKTVNKLRKKKIYIIKN